MAKLCAAEDRCRDFDRRNQVPAYTQDVPLCETCLRVGAHAVGILVFDYLDLEQEIGHFTAHPKPFVTGTREAPIVLNLSVEALQRSIWLLTTTWEQVLRDVEHLSDPPSRVRDGWAVQRAVEIIRPRVRRLAALPCTTVMPEGPDAPPEPHSGAEALLAMVALHRRVRAALGLTRLVHELPGLCAQCGLPALRRDDGTDVVYCGDCYAWVDVDHYRREVGLALAADRLLTRRSGATGGSR